MVIEPLESIDSKSSSNFNQLLTLEKPLVLAGAASAWPATSYTWDGLKNRFGTVKLPVRESDNEFEQFFGIRNSGRRTMMSLTEYIDLINLPARQHRLLPYAGNISILNDPAVSFKLPALISTCRFPDLLTGCSAEDYRLWIAAMGQKSTIHNDPYHNFNAQIIGRKRFILFPPDQHGKLYAEFFHPGMWASPVDPRSPDLAKYPNFRDAAGFRCELERGDILYIPRFWWHCAEATTPSLNINCWVFPKSRNEWWHQQPLAKQFVSYERLLEQVRSQFRALPAEIQAIQHRAFSELEADLARLVGE